MKGHTLKREAPFPASPEHELAPIDTSHMPVQPSPAAVDGLFFACDANRIQQRAARARRCLYVCEILTLREFVTGHFDMYMCIGCWWLLVIDV